jgi:hypothetical protein
VGGLAQSVTRRRRAGDTRTRGVVLGASIAAFTGLLAAFGLHGRSEPTSTSTVPVGDDGGAATSPDPGTIVPPGLGRGRFRSPLGGSTSGSDGSTGTAPFSAGPSTGGFSATPGAGRGSPDTSSRAS